MLFVVGKFALWDPCQPHVLIPLLGWFKGKGGDRMHVFPIVNWTRSGILVRLWVERLVATLRQENQSNCLAFCDDEGYSSLFFSSPRLFTQVTWTEKTIRYLCLRLWQWDWGAHAWWLVRTRSQLPWREGELWRCVDALTPIRYFYIGPSSCSARHAVEELRQARQER